MINYKFSRPIAEVAMMVSVLRRLNSGKVATFEDRLKSQKTQYLAQAFKVVPNYVYNLYIRGPYSPKLASDLFLVNEKNIDDQVSNFIPTELEKRFNELRTLVNGKSVRQLELLATLHWLVKVAGLSLDRAEASLVDWKKASMRELSATKQLLKQML